MVKTKSGNGVLDLPGEELLATEVLVVNRYWYETIKSGGRVP
jgi:hypothetical protein